MRKTPNSPDIGDNFIVCELCGRKYQSLTRHLIKKHETTSDEYKEIFGYCRSQPLECYDLQNIRREYSKKYRTFDKNFQGSEKYSFAVVGVPPKLRRVQEIEKNTISIKGKSIWEISTLEEKERLRSSLSRKAREEGWITRIKKMRR